MKGVMVRIKVALKCVMKARGKKFPLPILEEFGWASQPVWGLRKNLSTTGLLTPDSLALSQSLYEMRQSGGRVKGIVIG